MSERQIMSLRGAGTARIAARCRQDFIRTSVWRHPSCGRYLEFEGTPSLEHPKIGMTYTGKITLPVSGDICTRQLVLVGYYTKNGQVVACDFVEPTGAPQKGNFLDSDYFTFEIEKFRYLARNSETGSVFRNVRIPALNIVTLPNNPKDICSRSSTGNNFVPYLADYVLRRALGFYAGSPMTKKDALISCGSLRHGFSFDALDPALFGKRDICAPDLTHADHNFRHAGFGSMPAFAQEAVGKAVKLATEMRTMELTYGRLPGMPPLQRSETWVTPAIPSGRLADSYACERRIA